MNPIPLLVAAAAIVVLGKKDKKKPSKIQKSIECPVDVSIESSSIPTKTISVKSDKLTAEINIPQVAYDAASAGDKDIISILNKTISHLMHPSCFKDKNIIITFHGPDGDMKLSAPEMYSSMAKAIIEDLKFIKIFDTNDAENAMKKISDWASGS